MPSVFSYKLKAEIKTGEENSSIPLTKKFNMFQRAWLIKEENVRIKSLSLTYFPRTGTRGTGTIHAAVLDNRIDPDLGDRVINELDFDATEKMTAHWMSSIWIHRDDFVNTARCPFLFEMELTGCNMTAGNSIGKMVIVVEVVTSDSLDKFVAKAPTAKLTKDPYNLSATASQRFMISETPGPSVKSLRDALPRSLSLRSNNRMQDRNGDRTLSYPKDRRALTTSNR